MSGLMKIVLISTTTLTLFQENTQAFSLSQTQAVCPATHSLLTHLACVWLGGCLPLKLQGIAGQGCHAKKLSTV